MDTGVISGLVGGAISIVLVSYVSSKIRNSKTDGQLKYGWGLLVLAWACLAFVALAVFAFICDENVWKQPGELYSIIGLFIGFGAGTIYTFGEYFKVNGKYDNEGIVFNTPWTGVKNEKWCDLESIKFNASENWYVLKFKSGKAIRLSTLLGGYGGVLLLLDELGYDFS